MKAEILPAAELKLSELIASLSYALDITEGQPPGHCVRACWIGMHIGRQAGMAEAQLWELYYTLLLKDLGCSSNAARICELYLTDDLNFKRDYKTVGDSLPQVLGFVLKHTGLKAGLAERFRSVMTILRDGPEIARELVATRCQRGADIARLLRFPEGVADGIFSLDEHFNGNGKPARLAGEAIPLYSRIALLAQVIDVFHTESGREGALKEARVRAGQWFDPGLVRAFEQVAQSDAFWATLAGDRIDEAVTAMQPAGDGQQHALDDDYLDDIATAFGQVVDAKSPYTSGHSARVALYTDMIAEVAGDVDGTPALAQARGAAARRRQARRQQQRAGQGGRARPRRVGRRQAACRVHGNHPRQASAPSASWRRSPAPTTNGWTAAAIRAAWGRTTSASRRASSPPPTSSTRSRPRGLTAARSRFRRRWR
jgi:HD-GYP domain-containing protein (c-di-GMP phosphodiesterase class II)